MHVIAWLMAGTSPSIVVGSHGTPNKSVGSHGTPNKSQWRATTPLSSSMHDHTTNARVVLTLNTHLFLSKYSAKGSKYPLV